MINNLLGHYLHSILANELPNELLVKSLSTSIDSHACPAFEFIWLSLLRHLETLDTEERKP